MKKTTKLIGSVIKSCFDIVILNSGNKSTKPLIDISKLEAMRTVVFEFSTGSL